MRSNLLDTVRAQYENANHSLFSPSSSHAWLTCSAYILLNALAPDDGSEYAAYGTVAHDVAEQWLIDGRKPKHRIGTQEIVYAGDWGYVIEIDDKMMEYVRESVDRCIVLPGKHLTEQKVYFSQLTPIPNQGGTMDFAAINGRRVDVVDHKFGVGVRVYAERNSQAMLYALGLLFKYDKVYGGEYDLQEFVLKIHQPRLDHYDEWECTRDELLMFAGYVKERARLAWRLDAPRTPDPKACQFCKVQSTCAANAKMQLRMMADQSEAAFGEVTVEEIAQFKNDLAADLLHVESVDPLALNTVDLERLRPYKRMVEGFWKTLDHELLKRGLAGAPMTKYKVVEGRSNRVFRNPAEAASKLISLGCKPDEVKIERIVSPSEAEELLIKASHRRKDLPELLEELVRKPPGKPTLAPKSDKRPALQDPSAIAFADTSTDQDESE